MKVFFFQHAVNTDYQADLLDETRIAHTRRLLTRVSQAMAFGYGTGGNDYFDLGDVDEGDHGSFESWLFIEGLDVSGLPSYSESWWTASTYVRDLATPDPPSIDEVYDPDGATWEGDCVTPGCKCCLPKDMRALRVILDEELMDLPGVCLKCFLENGEDSLCSSYCSKPGHSGRASND
jgi:hypothetical protein